MSKETPNNQASNLASSPGPLGLVPKLLDPKDIDFGNRCRSDYDDQGELLKSIKEHGILQSILVLERPNQNYLLLAGGRRLKIALDLGLPTIPALVSTVEMDEYTIRVCELVENIHRKDFTFTEELKIKQKIHELMIQKHGIRLAGSQEKTGWTKQNTAELLGVSKSSIISDLRLANVIEAVPEVFTDVKTKSEAKKVLEKLVRKITIADKAAEFEKRTSDLPKNNLVNSYLVRDFFEGIKTIHDNSFDFAEIDPPYDMDLKALRKDNGFSSLYDKEDYKDSYIKDYPLFLTNLMKEIYRTLVMGGQGILWLGLGTLNTAIDICTSLGFSCGYHRIGSWLKPTSYGCQSQVPHILLAQSMEFFIYFTKGQNSKLNIPGSLNHFSYKPVPPSSKIHPTERPIELIQNILDVFVGAGSRVIVPFAGSGNTLLACANLKMSAIGFDLSKSYRDGFITRVYEQPYQNYRSYTHDNREVC